MAGDARLWSKAPGLVQRAAELRLIVMLFMMVVMMVVMVMVVMFRRGRFGLILDFLNE